MRSPYEPEAIEVIASKGTPRTVKFRNRPMEVKEILNIWRIDDEWWRNPISRLYHSLEFTTRTRFTVFQDLITRQWYRQNWV